MIARASPTQSAPEDDVDSAATWPGAGAQGRRTLVIACGALAREVLALGLDWLDLTCLPAKRRSRRSPRRSSGPSTSPISWSGISTRW